jgi:hypothetical protein
MRRRGESGQVLPLVAICLAALMGFGGLAVDVGYWRYQLREQQSATDAAALGGAQQLAYSSCPNQTAAITAAQNDASKGGFTNGGNVTVGVTNPPATGVFAGNSCAVQVTITTQKVASFFTRVFGGRTSGIAETTTAVAEVTSDDTGGCIFMLGTSDNTNFNSATVQAPKCSMDINGSANFHGSTIDAAGIAEGNYSGSNNGGTFTGASPVQALPAADPCPEIAGCAYIAANPPSTSPCNGVYGSNGVLTPGCYSNLNLNGATVQMQAGTYVFEGSLNMNKASITGSGVTIYIPAGTSTNFNKVSSLKLSPPTSGNYAGVTFYQVPSNTNGLNFNGSSTDLGGLIYAPTASMNYNGSQGQYVVLVAAYANFNGSSGLDFGPPVAGQSLIKKAVLTQ